MIRRPPRSTLFPYTRSSDLDGQPASMRLHVGSQASWPCECFVRPDRVSPAGVRSPSSWLTTDCIQIDRKSTRLNSSHGYISYAVFCLKKKIPHSLTDDGLSD